MSGIDVCAEELLKAEQGVQLVVKDLQAALSGANAVEALVLLPLIAQAGALGQSIGQLRTARVAGE